MTNSNYPARQQGTTISKMLRYEDFDEVQRVVDQLQDRGLFKHSSKAQVDERGTFVIITYIDPTVVSTRTSSSSTALARPQSGQRLALTQRAAPAAKPIYKRWWFAPSIIIGFVLALCGAGYWAFQQLKQLSAPNIGVGVVGFLFVVVLAVAIVKKVSGGGGGHSGGHGFHYGPCD